MSASNVEDEAIRARVLRALANSNPGAISELVRKCRESPSSEQIHSVLGLLEYQSKMVHTLANDVVLLLDDRRRLAELVKVYESLEEILDDTK